MKCPGTMQCQRRQESVTFRARGGTKERRGKARGGRDRKGKGNRGTCKSAQQSGTVLNHTPGSRTRPFPAAQRQSQNHRPRLFFQNRAFCTRLQGPSQPSVGVEHPFWREPCQKPEQLLWEKFLGAISDCRARRGEKPQEAFKSCLFDM